MGEWPRRKPLTVRITYLGGTEGWWRIEARGREWIRPSHLPIHELLGEVFGLGHAGGADPLPPDLNLK